MLLLICSTGDNCTIYRDRGKRFAIYLKIIQHMQIHSALSRLASCNGTVVAGDSTDYLMDKTAQLCSVNIFIVFSTNVYSRRSIDFSRRSIEFSRKSIDFSRKSIDFSRRSIDFSRRNIDFSRRTPTYEEITYMIRYLKQIANTITTYKPVVLYVSITNIWYQ